MDSYLKLLAPELILCIAACALILLGCSLKSRTRRIAPWIALLALVAVFVIQLTRQADHSTSRALIDPSATFRIFNFAQYIKLLAAGIGILLVLLAWPTNAEATGNSALNVGQETGEFFGLMLLSICGILLVASANDIILLFLGIELASIPTYIMVSISRPHPVAQEAGVKYFFLGAMSAAIMLFGFSYLYGVTGTIKLDRIMQIFHGTGDSPAAVSSWAMLAAVMLIAG